MGRRRSADSDGPGTDPALGVYFAAAQTMSNLHHYLAKRPEDVRFLKLIPRADGDWLCILGVYSEDGTPLVAYGSGELYTDALRGVSASIAGGKWKPDKFAAGG